MGVGSPHAAAPTFDTIIQSEDRFTTVAAVARVSTMPVASPPDSSDCTELAFDWVTSRSQDLALDWALLDLAIAGLEWTDSVSGFGAGRGLGPDLDRTWIWSHTNERSELPLPPPAAPHLDGTSHVTSRAGT